MLDVYVVILEELNDRMYLKTTNTAIYSEIYTLCGRIYLADSRLSLLKGGLSVARNSIVRQLKYF